MFRSTPTRTGRARRAVVAALATLITAASITVTVQTASAVTGRATPHAKPTIVLVHGAWADSSSFAPVTKRLQKDGYTVLAESNPLRGLLSDTDYLTSFLAQRTEGPVVLVGHSYGGAVITNGALADPDVKALVYVDAFAPAKGETVLGLQSSVPGAPEPGELFDAVAYPGAPADDYDLYIKQAAFPGAFANDLSRARGEELAASQKPVTLSALTTPSGSPAWASLPSWYVLGTHDNVIAPSLQRRMAKRAHSRITSISSGHLAMLSHPAAVTAVIERAARAKG